MHIISFHCNGWASFMQQSLRRFSIWEYKWFCKRQCFWYLKLFPCVCVCAYSFAGSMYSIYFIFIVHIKWHINPTIFNDDLQYKGKKAAAKEWRRRSRRRGRGGKKIKVVPSNTHFIRGIRLVNGRMWLFFLRVYSLFQSFRTRFIGTTCNESLMKRTFAFPTHTYTNSIHAHILFRLL